jgi:hypothetical protein
MHFDMIHARVVKTYMHGMHAGMVTWSKHTRTACYLRHLHAHAMHTQKMHLSWHDVCFAPLACMRAMHARHARTHAKMHLSWKHGPQAHAWHDVHAS